MEDALVQVLVVGVEKLKERLNPCFNGRCTSTVDLVFIYSIILVLILVLMEDALVLCLCCFYFCNCCKS